MIYNPKKPVTLEDLCDQYDYGVDLFLETEVALIMLHWFVGLCAIFPWLCEVACTFWCVDFGFISVGRHTRARHPFSTLFLWYGIRTTFHAWSGYDMISDYSTIFLWHTITKGSAWYHTWNKSQKALHPIHGKWWRFSRPAEESTTTNERICASSLDRVNTLCKQPYGHTRHHHREVESGIAKALYRCMAYSPWKRLVRIRHPSKRCVLHIDFWGVTQSASWVVQGN